MYDGDESVETYMSKDSSFGKAVASSIFSAPEPINVFSVFGDSDCGEPLEAHHLRLDFTPTDHDDDYSQKKCCEFWKYIASRSDLKHMMVLPEKEKTIQSTVSVSVSKPSPERVRVSRPKTAVSMLQIVENKDIDRAFEAKMQQSRCSLDSNDYELSAKAPISKTSCDDPNAGTPPAACNWNCNRYCSNYLQNETTICPRIQCLPNKCGCIEGAFYDKNTRKCVPGELCTPQPE